jgi:hypothetical protein
VSGWMGEWVDGWVGNGWEGGEVDDWMVGGWVWGSETKKGFIWGQMWEGTRNVL